MEKKGFFLIALFIIILSINFVSSPFGYDNPNLPKLKGKTFGNHLPNFYMPLNTSVFGNFSFNGGWLNDGFSIVDGDIYAQTGYFYNISSLNVSRQNLTIIDSLLVDDPTFFVDSSLDRVGIGTASPATKLHLADTGALQFILDADTDNSGESDTPSILFRRDGATEALQIGVEGTAGTTFTGSLANTPYIYSVSSAYGIQFATNDELVMEVKTGKDVSIKDCLEVTNEIRLGTDGNLSDPGYTWTDDGDMGLFRVGVDTLGFVTEGKSVMNLTDSQDVEMADVLSVENEIRLNTNGSATDPGYTWTDDGDMGLFRAGTDELGFTTGGSEAIRIDSSGNVGIGTSTIPLDGLPTNFASSGSLLEIGNGTVDSGITLRSRTSSSNAFDIWQDYGNIDLYIDSRRNDDISDIYFRIKTSGTPVNALTIKGSGNVGIGTNAPNSIFHIKADFPGMVGSDYAGQIIIQNPADSVFSNVVITAYESDADGNPDQQLWYLGSSSTGNSDIIFLNRRNSKLQLGTSGTTRMTILGNGNVGIGTTSPVANLHIKDTSFKMKLQATASDGDASIIFPAYAYDNLEGAGIIFDRDLWGTGKLYFAMNTNESWNDPYNLTLSDAVMTLDSTGGTRKVGIGTSTIPLDGFPTDFDSSGILLEIGDGTVDSGITLRSRTSSSNAFDIWQDYSLIDLYIDARRNDDNSDIYFRTKTSGTPINALTIKGSGNVGIGVTDPDSALEVNGNVHISSLEGSYTNGEAYLCVYNNGTIFAKDTACS